MDESELDAALVFATGDPAEARVAEKAFVQDDGVAIATGYDGANRPNAVTGTRGQTTNYASSVQYAPHGGVIGLALGNNVTPWFGYNSRLQMTLAQATINSSASAYLFVEEPNWGTTNNNGNVQSADE